MNKGCNPEILKLLAEKSSTKQFIYRQTKEIFAQFKHVVADIAEALNNHICDIDANVVVEFIDEGPFECKIMFSGDAVVFQMHTNVFTFEPNHMIWKNGYVKEDKMRAYFGVIHMYNFLADSFRFNRVNDYGHLMGRLFVNKEKHFFVEGKRQFAFLFNDVAKDVFDETRMRDIVEKCIEYALDFDLTSPDFNQLREITIGQIEAQGGYLNLSVRKRLGFKMSYEVNNQPKSAKE